MTDSDHDAPELADLEIIDRVARASHLWIRHRRAVGASGSTGYSPVMRHSLAAGVISGLCDQLELDRRCAVYSAYAYALLDSETEHALAIAYLLVNQQIEKKYRPAFQEGREAAANLMAILKWPELAVTQPGDCSEAVSH